MTRVKRTVGHSKNISNSLKKYWKQIKGSEKYKIVCDNIGKGRKGIPAWNKDKKNWLSEESNKARIQKMKGRRFSPETEFKKGHHPKTEFKKGHKPMSYIDGRSKFLSPGRYGDDWEKIRYVVYLRGNFTCQDCGINGKSLDVHHEIPFLYSKDNSIGNLVSLCRSCHAKREEKIKKEFKSQVILCQ